MTKAAKKEAAPKKRAAKYEKRVQTLLSFDQLIAISEGKKPEKKEGKKKESSDAIIAAIKKAICKEGQSIRGLTNPLDSYVVLEIFPDEGKQILHCTTNAKLTAKERLAIKVVVEEESEKHGLVLNLF